MKFGSWTYDAKQVDLKHMHQEPGNNVVTMGIDLTEFYLSVEWDILDVPATKNVELYNPEMDESKPKSEVDAENDKLLTDITFIPTMRRKTLFYTVNLIIPCVGISFLSVLVFYLPSDSGEKVSLSISILLSLTVFFLLLAEIIPPTSLAVPLLGKYLLFTMILVTLSVVVTIGVLNVNFRTPATHKMAPWVRKAFIDFLPKYLFIERPPPQPMTDDPPAVSSASAEINAGFNIVFPETLEERNSVSRLLNHAQYDGGGFRLGPPGDHTSLHLQPALTLQLDKFTPDRQVAMYTNGGNNGNYRSVDGNRVAMYGNKCNGDSCRFDSGFRDSGQLEQEPHLEKAINAVRFVAQHVKNQDRYNKVADDWKYVAMVLDRILLWLFSFACVAGTCGIILVAPSLYDKRTPLDVLVSKIGKRDLLPTPAALQHLVN